MGKLFQVWFFMIFLDRFYRILGNKNTNLGSKIIYKDVHIEIVFQVIQYFFWFPMHILGQRASFLLIESSVAQLALLWGGGTHLNVSGHGRGGGRGAGHPGEKFSKKNAVFKIWSKKTAFSIVEGLALCSIIYQILIITMACSCV